MCRCQCVRVLGRLPDGPEAECQGAAFCGACGSGTEGGGVSSVAQRLVWLLMGSKPALGGFRTFAGTPSGDKVAPQTGFVGYVFGPFHLSHNG